MKKVFYILIVSGIWLQPISLMVLTWYLGSYHPYLLANNENKIICILVSFIPTFLVWSSLSGKPSADKAIIGREKAMYPQIPTRMLSRTPCGIVLGKDRRSKKYVCKKLEEDGHVFLIGGSGSGKSSALVIPTLLVNRKIGVFAVDIKGELSFKTARYGDEHVVIFNPADRRRYGYDPLYRLTEESSTQEIMETMQTVAFSLIQLPADVKDPFWKCSARNLFIGLLIYYYRQGANNFVDIIDSILGRPVKESIQAVISNSKPSSVEYRYTVQFDGMEDETLGGIIAEMNNHIVIFANDQDIRYAFKENPTKMTPLDLEKGYSIYLSVQEEKLSVYYDVMQLIINQTLAQLEARPEDSEPIIFVIDELPRILSAGKIDRLLDGARTLRSRKVCLYLITQSTEALMTAFTENEVSDLISNCPYIVVLSATSVKTQKSVCEWCGKYKAKKTSWSGTGKGRKTSISYEEKDIVESSDLMTLKNSGEAILISPYGYFRVDKTPYYQDSFFSPIADEIVRYNKTISDM